MQENKLKDLVTLYEKLLAHLDGLAGLSTSSEDVLKNAEEIKALNETHFETRDFARNLLTHDFTQETKNPFIKLFFKELNPQSILFINLVTDYNQRLVDYIEGENKEDITLLIKDIKDFNVVAKKQFKPLQKKLKNLNK